MYDNSKLIIFKDFKMGTDLPKFYWFLSVNKHYAGTFSVFYYVPTLLIYQSWSVIILWTCSLHLELNFTTYNSFFICVFSSFYISQE